MVPPLHHVVLLFFFFILFSFQNYSQSLTTNYDDEERDILLSLKQHLGNPSSTSSPCYWPYISCIAGSVTRISLLEMNLQGSLPSKIICQLNNLTSINLYMNNLWGTIPVGLSTCSNLETLDLSTNHLTGTIPGELFSMKRLRILSLQENMFSCEIPTPLVAYSLEYLALSDNQLNGSIPDDIGNLYNLGYLDLSSNSLSGTIPARLLRLHKLSYLSLAHNNLTGEIPTKLHLFSLNKIDLSHNHLSGTIPSGFGELRYLWVIDVSDNKFSGDICGTVSHMWAKHMIELRFCLNHFSGRISYEIQNREDTYNTCFDEANLFSDVMYKGLPACSSHRCSHYIILGSNPNESKKVIITCAVIPGGLIGLVILILLFRSRGLQQRRKEKEGEEEEWGMISFQRLDFREGEILGGLIDENLIGSGGSGYVLID